MQWPGTHAERLQRGVPRVRQARLHGGPARRLPGDRHRGGPRVRRGGQVRGRRGGLAREGHARLPALQRRLARDRLRRDAGAVGAAAERGAARLRGRGLRRRGLRGQPLRDGREAEARLLRPAVVPAPVPEGGLHSILIEVVPEQRVHELVVFGFADVVVVDPRDLLAVRAGSHLPVRPVDQAPGAPVYAAGAARPGVQDHLLLLGRARRGGAQRRLGGAAPLLDLLPCAGPPGRPRLHLPQPLAVDVRPLPVAGLQPPVVEVVPQERVQLVVLARGHGAPALHPPVPGGLRALVVLLAEEGLWLGPELAADCLHRRRRLRREGVEVPPERRRPAAIYADLGELLVPLGPAARSAARGRGGRDARGDDVGGGLGAGAAGLRLLVLVPEGLVLELVPLALGPETGLGLRFSPGARERLPVLPPQPRLHRLRRAEGQHRRRRAARGARRRRVLRVLAARERDAQQRARHRLLPAAGRRVQLPPVQRPRQGHRPDKGHSR
mmetsp:Transcript_141925/g.344730  ORF Transcript_141925/g.344730 Transcript_141925/m.344730 type:complete len:497 (-) Transcript_141925:45-1535(-)